MKVKFLEAREVRDGEGVVIQKFRAGQVIELSTASARHWINRGAALDVQAAAQAAREAEKVESTEEKVETVEEKGDATDGTVNPTPPKRGRGRPPSASRPVQA